MKTQAKNNVVILGRAVNLFPETGQGKKIRDISAFVAMAIAAFMSQDVFADGGVMDTSDYQKRALNEISRSDNKIAIAEAHYKQIADEMCGKMKDALDQMFRESDPFYYEAEKIYRKEC